MREFAVSALTGCGTRAPATTGGHSILSNGLRRGVAGVSAVLLLAACTSPPRPPAGTNDEGDGQNSVEEQVRQLAADLAIADPPQVDVVRLVAPEDRGRFVDACLTEQGYSPTRLSEVGLPAEQTAAFDLVRFTCLARYPVDPDYLRAWSEEQIVVQYEWTVDHVIPCLADRGFLVTDVPSRAEFVTDWPTEPFYPFAQLADESLTNDDWDVLNEDCQQSAPSELLWAGND